MGCHAKNVKKLKNMVCNDYQYDFFQSEPLKAITTGKEAPYDVAQYMLSSVDMGNECVKKTFWKMSFETDECFLQNNEKQIEYWY